MSELTITLDGRKGQVAVIESTHLGFEDHGMLSWNISFAGPGWGQGTGHYLLGGTSTNYDCPFLAELIATTCIVVGVDTWEQLKGKRVIVLRDEPYGAIVGFADLHGERTLILKEWMQQRIPRSEQFAAIPQ